MKRAQMRARLVFLHTHLRYNLPPNTRFYRVDVAPAPPLANLTLSESGALQEAKIGANMSAHSADTV